MMTHTGVEVLLHSCVTLALDGGQQSASHPWLLYTEGKNPQYQMYRRMVEPQNQSGLFGDEKNIPPMPGIELQFHTCPTHKLVTILSHDSTVVQPTN
jgi:hypothetical protein